MAKSSQFSKLLDVEDVSLLLAQFLGRSALRRFRPAWPSAHRWVRQVLPRMVHGGAVYVCGGYSGAAKLRAAERFDVRRKCWEKLPEMLEARPGPAASSFEGDFYVVGTNDASGRATGERYVAPWGRWEALPVMRQGRERCAAAVVGGSLYVCGGVEKETEFFSLLRSVERLRLDGACEWEAQPAMLEPRDSPAAAGLGRHLYVCGGDGLQFQPLNSVECFDVDAGVWKALPPMFDRRSGAAAAALGGQIYVCGGSDGVRRLRSVERYDPETASWHSVPAMLRPRFAPALACMAGKLYVCGGADDGGNLGSVECFEPATGWREVAPMHAPRVRGAAAAVWD